MPLNWTFGRKLGAGFAMATLTLVVIAFSGYRSTQHLIENSRWVNHAQQVRMDLTGLLSMLKDVETGLRGYVITGNDAFLEETDADQINRAFANLRKLVSDNESQLRRLDAARPVIDARLAHATKAIELRKTLGLEAGLEAVTSGEGKKLMDQVRAIFDEMDRDERERLERRRNEAEASADSTEAVILWGSVLGVVLVGLVGLFISRSLSAQIGGAVRRVQSSSAELQSASSQQATGAREQATAMSEISTTITELLATSRQIAESARRVAQISEQTAAAARSGDATVGKGNESVAGIRRQVDVIVNHMLDLGKKSQQIGSVLDIVSELAEQTNILAINATIEAAGAGEAGKRFGVVADEIRKLADRVAGSTKEIRALIDDVRSAVNTTVMTTEGGSKAVEAGSRQFAEVAAAFAQIAKQVTTTMEAAKEIELSTKQQTTAVEQVNIAITNVAQATKETEVSTGQTLQTASELSVLSRELLKIVQPETSSPVRQASA
jgi:methyl-accepting chemotaxis protein